MLHSTYLSIVIAFLSSCFTIHLTGQDSFAQQLEQRILSRETILPIATIVEAFLATTSYDDSAEFLLKRLNNHVDKNNDIRERLAEKWIHNATANIFCNDFRSFLEIIVNACDASTPLQNCVGKFGMGFFSLLELLDFEETGGTSIEIDTTYQHENQLIRYGIQFFRDTKKHLYVKFIQKNSEEKSSTGTTVFIKPMKRIFSENVILDLIKYVGMLRHYKHVPINLSVDYQQKYCHEIVNPDATKKTTAHEVSVILSPTTLEVTDQGTGIPLKIALTKLLVPSSSSKTQTTIPPLSSFPIERPKIVPQTSIASDECSHFFITTNGIIILDKIISTKLVNEHGMLCDLVIPMPQPTQLAVARNELLIAPDGSSQEEKHLRQMIRATVLTAVHGNKKNTLILEAFYEGLFAWEQESGAQHLHGRFTSFLQRELDQALNQNKKIFPVPLAMTRSLFESIAPESNIQLIQIKPDLVAHNYEKFETFLIEYYCKNLSYFFSSHYTLKQEGILGLLILGKNIIFVPDHFISEPTTLDLRQIFFVPESFLLRSLTKTELINSILSSLPTQRLRPHASRNRKTPFFFDFQTKDPKIQISKKDSLWIENIARPLVFIAPNLQNYLILCFTGFNVFEYQCMTSQELSPTTKELVQKLKQSLWGRANTYYSITTSNLPARYDSQCQFSISLSNNGTFSPLWANAMKTLLEKLEQNQQTKTIVPSLIDFQARDFIQKTDLFNRNQKLGAFRLHIPDMCLGTPLGLLGALASIEKFSDKALMLIANAVQEVRSLEELMFISISLFTMPREKFNALCSPEGITAIRCAIQHYIQKKIDPRLLKKFYDTITTIDFSSSNHIDPAINDDHQLCKTFQTLLISLLQQTINFPEITSMLPSALKHLVQNPTTVFLSQLIGAHCSNNGLSNSLENEHPEKILEFVSKIPIRTLEKIGINSENGSERASFEATVIECLQNSIDATKSLYSQQPTLFDKDKEQTRTCIDLELGWMKTTNQKTALVFSIHDRAGFKSIKELLTEFILPDLSSKTSEKKLVGQMGNGSFCMYKNAEIVHILTKTTQQHARCYLLTVKPMRNAQTGTIYDLQLSWHDVTKLVTKHIPSFLGTSISLQFLPSPHHNGTQFNLVEGAHFLRNSLGNCNINLHDKKNTPFIITLNHTDQLNDPNNCEILYTCKSGCRLLKNSNPLQQSYLTTGGIPFRPLISVIREMKLLPENFCDELEQGYTIDLPPNFYTPVQSRTRLRINKENRKILTHLCFELFFIAGVYKAITEITEKRKYKSFLSKHFTHFFSDGHIWFTTPDPSDNTQFQKCLEDWIKTKKISPLLSPELFFDFYKPLSFAQNSFSNFYDLVTNLSRKMYPAYFDLHKELVDKYFENHQDVLEKALTARDAHQAPEITLSIIKHHFGQILDRIEQNFNETCHKTLINFVAKKLNKVTLDGNKFNTLSTKFIEFIIKQWIDPKMRASNFVLDRSIAYSLLFENQRISAVKSNVSKSKQTEIMNKQNPNALVKISDSNLKVLTEAWTIFCQEFFTAIGLSHNDIQCRATPNLPNNVGGHYIASTNTIELNMSHIDIYEQTQLFKALKIYDHQKTSFELITEISGFKGLYAPIIGKAPTLLHELEHARRAILLNKHLTKTVDTANNSSPYGHGDHTHSHDAQGNFVCFDACANSWGAHAIKHGLIQNWAQRLAQLP